MLEAYDGSLPHPRSKSAFQNDRGHFVCIDADARPTDCLYCFNSLGYRGEEFDSTARLKVFVAGCSYTFGLGVEHDQTWPALLKLQLAAKLEVPIDQTNLQNFSQIGASNGYIARTIIRQCERVRPNLAVIAFTHRERTEYLAPGVTRNLGLWDLDYPEDWAAPAMRYFSLHNTESGHLDLLKNMLLVQWAMTRRRIPYLMLWMNRTTADQAPISDLPPLRQLREMIDPTRLSLRCLLEPEINVDSTLVERHPGPKSHANFAPLVLEAFDLSVPKDVPVPHLPEPAPRRILALGNSRANTGDVADCTDGHCLCRQMEVRHRLRGLAVDRPLAENASNDRIVRTLLEQCSQRKPDFVFVDFSTNRSCEHFHEQKLVELDLTSPSSPTPELARPTDAYREFTTDELHDLNVLRNILMTQEFLEMQCLPHILSIPPAFRWRNMDAAGSHPVLRMYASLINPSSLCNRRPREVETASHPGAGPPMHRRPIEITWELVNLLKKRFAKSRTEDPNIYPLW
ncbi:MAG: hypothetical protein K9G48_03375 [Reyranella sp.]|nr:hypothetical protein [Reyranella sp.]